MDAVEVGRRVHRKKTTTEPTEKRSVTVTNGINTAKSDPFVTQGHAAAAARVLLTVADFAGNGVATDAEHQTDCGL